MIGKTISHYQIQALLGQGGMGVVYKAADTKLDRTVALKFLPLALGGEDGKARFLNEAQSAAKLQHPNICTIHEINEVDGQPYIAMAFIDGKELKDLLSEGQLPVANAVNLGLQIASGVGEAHSHGVIHRDIKSANVMIDHRGLAKVMDFGIAKRSDQTGITQAGTSLGTVDYMSPEQARGEASDHRSDIWSFGVLLYEMLTGSLPFHAGFEQAVIYSILNEEPKPIDAFRNDVPASLRAVVAKAMHKDPEQRYQSMDAVVAELADVQNEVGVPAGATGQFAGVTGATSRVRAQGSTGNAMRALVAGAIYGVATIVVALVLKWAVGKYPISPNLPNFAVMAMAALVPAVFLLGYDPKGSAARFGIPLNLAVAAALLFVMFQGKDLGAATTTVTYVDENGNTVERAIPKGEFLKRVAVFYADNETGDPDNDWMSYGLLQLLRADLVQDPYLVVGMGFTDAHNNAGFDTPVGAPRRFKQKTASEFHYTYFLESTIAAASGDGYNVSVKLSDTQSGRVVGEFTYAEADLFAVADKLSVAIRRALGVPEYHIESSPDLAVADIFTDKPEAIRHYVNGINLIWQDNNHAAAAAELQQSVDIDPTFADGYWSLSDAYASINRPGRARAAIRDAVKNNYRLPERRRFELYNSYYEFMQDEDADFENAVRWVKLHPGDASARNSLANHYERLGRFDDAIRERSILFDLDPARVGELHSLAYLCEQKGDFERAEEFLHRYEKRFPNDYKSYLRLAQYSGRRGDLASARKYYETAISADPTRVYLSTSLADMDRREGKLLQSQRQLEEALAGATTPGDSATVYRSLANLYLFMGKAQAALGEFQHYLDVDTRQNSPMQATINRVFGADYYVYAGRGKEHLAFLQQLSQQNNVSWMEQVIAAGRIITFSMMNDPANAEEMRPALATFEEWVQKSRTGLLWAVDLSYGSLLLWDDDVDAAMDRFDAAVTKVPNTEPWQLTIAQLVAGTVARQLGHHEKATNYYNATLEREPFHPSAHLGLAQIAHEQGDRETALKHLRIALEVWRDADENFIEVPDARKLADELNLSL